MFPWFQGCLDEGHNAWLMHPQTTAPRLIQLGIACLEKTPEIRATATTSYVISTPFEVKKKKNTSGLLQQRQWPTVQPVVNNSRRYLCISSDLSNGNLGGRYPVCRQNGFSLHSDRLLMPTNGALQGLATLDTAKLHQAFGMKGVVAVQLSWGW